MRLKGVRKSQNIEDRRRSGGVRGGAKIGGAGLLLILALGYFTGVDVTPLLEGTQTTQTTRRASPEEERAAAFSSQVLATTETVWGQIFPAQVGRPIPRQRSCCSPAKPVAPVAGPLVRQGRFIARRIKRPISTLIFSQRCRNNLARAVISPPPM